MSRASEILAIAGLVFRDGFVDCPAEDIAAVMNPFLAMLSDGEFYRILGDIERAYR